MNKNNRLIIRLMQMYIPLPIRVFISNMGVLGRFFVGTYPINKKSDLQSNPPVFIISAGRSGTTLMRSMLVASGQIAIPAETQIIHKLLLKFIDARGLGWEDQARLIISSFESHHHFYLWQANLAEVYQKVLTLPKVERSLARVINEVFMTYARQKFPEAKFWGDQSPIHTLYLPDINKIFPNAKYLHLLRDGRDVVASKMTRSGGRSLYSAVHRWKICIKRTKQLQKKIGANQYLEVRYENLVRNPESTLQQVCQFIGIEYTPLMLDYWKLPSTIENKYFSYHKNLSKPVFSSSIGKWKKDLTIEQQEFVLKNISEELRELGYLE